MVEEQLQAVLNTLTDARSLYIAELEGLPDGKLIISRRKGGYASYYVKRQENGAVVKRGITKKTEVIRGLARKEYLRRSLSAIETNIHVIERAQLKYKPCDPAAIIDTLSASYENLPPEYFFEPLSDAVHLSLDGTLEEKIKAHEKWGQQDYITSDHMPETRVLITSRGEKMRSKSEVLIAEKLYQYQIPFRYEQRLDLPEVTLFPDFTFEGSQGHEFYLEFCGMMDNEQYVVAHKRKLAIYQAAGIVPWENIIYLYAKGNELNMQRVDSLIQTQIIPWL